jgi:hypothetical protein
MSELSERALKIADVAEEFARKLSCSMLVVLEGDCVEVNTPSLEGTKKNINAGNVEIMSNSLSVQAAKQLIEFISTTNYELAPHGDGTFSSASEAVDHVNSTGYDVVRPLDVCFDTKQGNYWEGAQITFQDSEWFIEDLEMGGKSSKGKSIQSAIEAFRLKHDLACDYCPVELILNEEQPK